MSLFGDVLATTTLASLGIPGPEVAPKIIASGWYLTAPSVIGTTAALNAANSIHFTPIMVPLACSVNQALVEVTVASATQNLRVGLYRTNADGTPGTLLVDGGAVVSAGTVGIKAWTLATTALAADWYMLGITGTAAITMRSCGAIPQPTNVQASAFSNFGIRTTATTYPAASVMPAGPFAASALTTGNLCPIASLKVA